MSADAPLLSVEDLRVQFVTEDGIVHAVDGVSYSVATRTTLGIVGESGSGKTVTSLTTMGLTRGRSTRVSGRIMFEGRDLLKLSDDDLRSIRGDDIAMIFQDPLSSLHPFYKVGDQLIEAVRAHRDVSRAAARDRAVELLELVGIPDPRRRVDQYPHEFSGGMRRLCMAIIIITHDLGVVAEIADEIAVMYAGRVVEHGSTGQIFSAPQHPYTWGLLKSIPRLDTDRSEELVPISGRPPSLIHRPSGCFFHPRCPYVRDRHRKIDPGLEPIPEENGHEVACLLEPELRSQIWKGLQAGQDPAELRRLVLEGDKTLRTTAAARAPQGGGP